MREHLKKLLDGDISRREFAGALAALGFSASAIGALARTAAATPAIEYEMTGSGGEILAAILESAGIEYVFNCNSTGQNPFYDALGRQSNIGLIMALQEGQATAMAHGYELAGRRVGALVLPSIGIPNAVSNLYNAWKDRSSIALFSDGRSTRDDGRDGFQQFEDPLQIVEQFTKWRWRVDHSDRIAELSRRAIKLAATPPGGPVYVRIPADMLGARDVSTSIYPRGRFTVSVELAPQAEPVERAARYLVEAENPVIHAGPEVSRGDAVADLVELAELTGTRVTQGISPFCDFPKRNPLFAGMNSLGFPNRLGRVDVFMNLGSIMPNEAVIGVRPPRDAVLINARLEYERIADLYPTDIAIAAGSRETIRALIDSIESQVTGARLRSIREPRIARARENYTQWIERRDAKARENHSASPIADSRLCLELDARLDDDAIIVVETGDSTPQDWFDFGPGRKTQIGPTTGYALGWGIAASLGSKIAQPDRQVACLVGDGAMLFGQIEALWTASRYDIPVIIVVFNNRSYDAERGRMKMFSRLPRDEWKDMACYLGNPDVDFVRVAEGFDIEGLHVTTPGELGRAIDRAADATRAGRPFILDVRVARKGPGAESTWHPEISIAARRRRRA